MTDFNEHIHGVEKAKSAYIEGRITLEVLELALYDRMAGTGYRHDPRIDGHLPRSVASEQNFRYRQ